MGIGDGPDDGETEAVPVGVVDARRRGHHEMMRSFGHHAAQRETFSS